MLKQYIIEEIKSTDCYHCMFYKSDECAEIRPAPCGSGERPDKTGVIFKLVGERDINDER